MDMAEPEYPLLPYEIALGDGEFARLVLPRDLTKAEADRLCGVIQALAFSEPPQKIEIIPLEPKTLRGGLEN
jgi:hypothetical protein